MVHHPSFASFALFASGLSLCFCLFSPLTRIYDSVKCGVLIYYALPVVCTLRYILLAKRSILTKAQVEPMMDILFQCKLYLGPKGSLEIRS
jgi:hypothetical protein